jgi:hypothetical protein
VVVVVDLLPELFDHRIPALDGGRGETGGLASWRRL